MQNTLRILVCTAVLALTGSLSAQQSVHIICEGERLQFSPEKEYWGTPSWEYSGDEKAWETLNMPQLEAYEIQPEKTGYYRLKLYDASCDSSYYSNVEYIEVRKWIQAMQLHSTHPGYDFDPGDSLYFWVDGEHLPEGITFWVNQKEVAAGSGKDLLIPGMKESFTIHATAGKGEHCYTSDTLSYQITSEGIRDNVPCEEPYPQVQNLSAEVSEDLGGVLLSWDAIPGSIGCRIRYREVVNGVWSVQTVAQADMTEYLIAETNLTPDTEYEWQVRCGCSQNPIIAGPWSQSDNFTSAYPTGPVNCIPGGTQVVDVLNPVTGKTWMDRNLGASQVATSLNDEAAYGDLYQWGRFSDGHQCRNSPLIFTTSSTDTPGHGSFITQIFFTNDWRSQPNDSLWKGLNGINNPCPTGYGVPTEAFLNEERQSWSSDNRSGAATSPLKLPPAGLRSNIMGGLVNVNTEGYYWSSTVAFNGTRGLHFFSNGVSMTVAPRSQGRAVRCIKAEVQQVGIINSLGCEDAGNVGSLTANQVVLNASSLVTYTGGNGGYYSGQVLQSTGVSGLTATLQGGFFENGSGNLVFTITGTPQSSGEALFASNVGGQSCTLSVTVAPELVPPAYPSGTVHCIPGGAQVVEVLNPQTNRIWMDRNLGASQVATSKSDEAAFGDLYQWGRFSDGHQCRTSPTTDVISSSEMPGHGDFITSSFSNDYDWLSPGNSNLWQLFDPLNNPCPEGYKLPTQAELANELNSWTSYSLTGAFGSPLKLSAAGTRHVLTGSLESVGSLGNYWSRTAIGLSQGTRVSYIAIHGNPQNTGLRTGVPADGKSVRCIKYVGGTVGSVDTLACGLGIDTGTLISGVAASDVTGKIFYGGGNGLVHYGQQVASTGVTGLTATLNPGTFNVGTGSLTYTISGTPSGAGTASFGVNIGGQICTYTRNVE